MIYIDVIENVESLPRRRASFARSIRSASIKSFDELHTIFDEIYADIIVRIRCAEKGITENAAVDNEISRAKQEDLSRYQTDGRLGLANALRNSGLHSFMIVDDALHYPYYGATNFGQDMNGPFNTYWLNSLKESLKRIRNDVKWKVDSRMKSIREWLDGYICNGSYINHAAIRAFGEKGMYEIPNLISALPFISKLYDAHTSAV